LLAFCLVPLLSSFWISSIFVALSLCRR
jgi:hypothetical protein